MTRVQYRQLSLVWGLAACIANVGCDSGARSVPSRGKTAPADAKAKAKTGAAAQQSLASRRSKPAPRPLTEFETGIAGTWVAKVGADAPQSKAMGDKVMLGIPPGQGGVEGLMAAVDADQRLSTACVWLELYDNLSGFHNECALIGGEPQALNKHDPLTGAVQPFGVGLSWSVDGKQIRVEYEQPLVVPNGAGVSVEIRTTTLELQPGAGPIHSVQQAFPEHPDIAPRTVPFEILAGSYLGDP
ncbi:MAG: hypothetical protein K0V04_36075 [Deltaproteobacteria bacterium]|nr:hypothetical protein [Deltaproteobacteria bacterium]